MAMGNSVINVLLTDLAVGADPVEVEHLAVCHESIHSGVRLVALLSTGMNDA